MRTWLVAFAAAALISIYYVLEGWLLDVQSAGGRLVAPTRATVAVIAWWLVWAALAPVVLAFLRTHPVDRQAIHRALFGYLLAALGFALLHGMLSVPIWLRLTEAPPVRNYGELVRVVWWTVLRAPSAIVQFLVFAVAYHAVAFARALRDREVATSRLGEALARAELDALKMRLEPHFLFNTLNAISAYIRTSPVLAERMVARLSRLLRGVLELRGEQEVTLARELELLEQYLDIQSLRFGERLSTRVEVDESVRTALLPALLLQPLVENALQHGLSRRPGPGRIVVSGWRSHEELHLRVEEQPVGSMHERSIDTAETGFGLGLSTTRSRLEQLYGRGQRLTLDSTPNGSVASVVLPYRESSTHQLKVG